MKKGPTSQGVASEAEGYSPPLFSALAITPLIQPPTAPEKVTMTNPRQPVVSYLRYTLRPGTLISLEGRSSISLFEQRGLVDAHLDDHRAELVAEYIEVETTRRPRTRPALSKALEDCQTHSATLLIAKTRSIHRQPGFVRPVLESGAKVVFLDRPAFNEDNLRRLAIMPRHELVEQCRHEALEAFRDIESEANCPPTLAELVEYFSERGMVTASGSKWSAKMISEALATDAATASINWRQRAKDAGQAKRAANDQAVVAALSRLEGLDKMTADEMAYALDARGYETHTGIRFSRSTVRDLLRRAGVSLREAA